MFTSAHVTVCWFCRQMAGFGRDRFERGNTALAHYPTGASGEEWRRRLSATSLRPPQLMMRPSLDPLDEAVVVMNNHLAGTDPDAEAFEDLVVEVHTSARLTAIGSRPRCRARACVGLTRHARWPGAVLGARARGARAAGGPGRSSGG